MTIKNLKQIAIKYASTKGSRIPLAPDELCNAVVQYFNEFLKITADINTIQVAVTEEGGNIVFTITGNTLDGKAFTPIVITVDHNDFVTNQKFEEFKTSVNEFLKITADISTIQVAVTEEGGNIVFTITGNTLDGKAFTPIVITVDHNDFVTNQKFEEFKTSVTEQLNNKLNKITSYNPNSVLYANIEGNDSQVRYTAYVIPNTILYRDDTGKVAVVKGVSDQDVANMENIADVEAKIPDVSNFADVTRANTFAEINTFNKRVYFKEIHFEDNDYNIYNTYANNQGIYSKYVADVSENMYNIKELGLYYYCLGTVTNDGMFHEFLFPNEGGTLALTSDIPAIPEYTSVDSVIYDTTNGAIIAYNGANEIHIPLLAGENVTIDASEDNRKIVISAAGGGGTGDVTAAGNNTFTGENTFNNSIYAKNGVVVGDTTNYGANSVTKGSNTYSFPNKSGTFAMANDIIKEPIYFISFYINAPDETLHLTGTMMSKNSYGTGQKTNEEFAVMLADNLYTNSNEGLAVYGKLVELTEKVIICIYSEDGLSIRYLDEKNSNFELPTSMFFIMETEL